MWPCLHMTLAVGVMLNTTTTTESICGGSGYLLIFPCGRVAYFPLREGCLFPPAGGLPISPCGRVCLFPPVEGL